MNAEEPRTGAPTNEAMTPALVRLRGTVAHDARFAWLHEDGRVRVSGEPVFELDTEDGAHVRVEATERTELKWCAARYSGPPDGLEEFDASHPFRDPAPSGNVVYNSVTLASKTRLEVWGTPASTRPETSGYRTTRGTVNAVRAAHVRVRLDDDERPMPLSRWLFVGLALSVAAFVYAIAIANVLPARLGFLLAVGCVRQLHGSVSDVGPAEKTPRFPTLQALLRVWFWSYLAVALAIPWQGTTLIGGVATIVLAASLAWWANAAYRRHWGKRAIWRALLSPSAVDGIVQPTAEGGRVVHTESGTLGPSDLACEWTDLRLDVQSLVDRGQARCALVARLGGAASGWALHQANDRSGRATLARAYAWDRVMPAVYIVAAIASLALWWPWKGA